FDVGMINFRLVPFCKRLSLSLSVICFYQLNCNGFLYISIQRHINMPRNKPNKRDSSDSDSGPEDRTPVKKSKPNPPPKSTSSRNDDGEPSWDIGKNRSVKLSEFRGKWYVNIREYYMADSGDLRPG
ncbi:hypothetical protein AMK59_4514, partial [Oryctes borbonicus]